MLPGYVICFSACSVGKGTFDVEGGTYEIDLSRCNGKGGVTGKGVFCPLGVAVSMLLRQALGLSKGCWYSCVREIQ